MSSLELSNIYLHLFEQMREHPSGGKGSPTCPDKDSTIAYLTGKLYVILENQKQQKLDLESWLLKECKKKKEREYLAKTSKNLNDIIKGHNHPIIHQCTMYSV